MSVWKHHGLKFDFYVTVVYLFKYLFPDNKIDEGVSSNIIHNPLGYHVSDIFSLIHLEMIFAHLTCNDWLLP